jgi:hypothetical protein
MKRLIALATLVSALGMYSYAAGKKVTVRGTVSDAKCGTHLNAECAKKCVGAGEAPILVTDKDQTVYKIANPDELKSHAGEHVAVTGSLDGDTLTVSRVRALASSKAKTTSGAM